MSSESEWYSVSLSVLFDSSSFIDLNSASYSAFIAELVALLSSQSWVQDFDIKYQKYLQDSSSDLPEPFPYS